MAGEEGREARASERAARHCEQQAPFPAQFPIFFLLRLWHAQAPRHKGERLPFGYLQPHPHRCPQSGPGLKRRVLCAVNRAGLKGRSGKGSAGGVTSSHLASPPSPWEKAARWGGITPPGEKRRGGRESERAAAASGRSFSGPFLTLPVGHEGRQ